MKLDSLPPISNNYYIKNNHCKIIIYLECLTHEIKNIEKKFDEKEIMDKIKKTLIDNKRCEKFSSCSHCKHEYFKSYEGN